MRRSASELIGYALRTTEKIGHVKDFLFDDLSWGVRYIVVDTGTWLPGKQVLVSPHSAGDPVREERLIPTNLTTEQVENAPALAGDRPVSRQHEIDLAEYYGWPAYWAPPLAMAPPPPPPPPAGGQEAGRHAGQGDEHLRGTEELGGYGISATDGHIGHVDDFIIDTESPQWMVRYLVVDTRDWLPGKKVLVSPEWVVGIEWAGKKVFVDHNTESIKDSPTFDPSAPVNREYEIRLYDYYGRPAYWED
jgi:uncharacterized protein YrrD